MFVVVCVCGCIERCCGGIGHRAGWVVVVVPEGTLSSFVYLRFRFRFLPQGLECYIALV